ncbi:GNAT family N-acetyltransferase [Aquimarina agarilytica]|uniref:GNAT family N-acetyltransferase n=1 Tax=Aquimarina agarilytica TaxID=1087449 RepID=UPI00028928F3|nr:GNAT family N-acetyltransferase [Aquimarina agarilytica]
MITLKRINSDNSDFKKLAQELDTSLRYYYKGEQSFYEELNNLEKIKYAIVAYNEKRKPIGCGGIKKISEDIAEIKRMYVDPTFRGNGIATMILNELEKWAIELNFSKCILETLKTKPYAIAFYTKNKYSKFPNYGEYVNAKKSICFQKKLN